MKTPNLRDGDSAFGEGKLVDDTKMLNTEARETVDYNENNENKEHVTTHPAFGPDGAKGRVG